MKFNRATIVDLECTCWEGYPPKSQINEIIEIGCCLYDKEKGLVNKRSILVRPDVSQVSEYCMQLTGHTWKELKDAPPFADAVRTLQKNYPIKSCPWLSWGDYDRIQFVKDCELKGVEYPFGRTHINLKAVHALLFGKTRGIAVGQAIEELGLTFEGRPHNGADDAWMSGKIFQEIVQISTRAECNFLN